MGGFFFSFMVINWECVIILEESFFFFGKETKEEEEDLMTVGFGEEVTLFGLIYKILVKLYSVVVIGFWYFS